MINGCVAATCFRRRSSSVGQRISPLATLYAWPSTPLSPSGKRAPSTTLTTGCETRERWLRGGAAAGWAAAQTPHTGHGHIEHRTPQRVCARHHAKASTTSFSSATTLTFTGGAGVTAAAGTRLSLRCVWLRRSTVLRSAGADWTLVPGGRRNACLGIFTARRCLPLGYVLGDRAICAPAVFPWMR